MKVSNNEKNVVRRDEDNNATRRTTKKHSKPSSKSASQPVSLFTRAKEVAVFALLASPFGAAQASAMPQGLGLPHTRGRALLDNCCGLAGSPNSYYGAGQYSSEIALGAGVNVFNQVVVSYAGSSTEIFNFGESDHIWLNNVASEYSCGPYTSGTEIKLTDNTQIYLNGYPYSSDVCAQNGALAGRIDAGLPQGYNLPPACSINGSPVSETCASVKPASPPPPVVHSPPPSPPPVVQSPPPPPSVVVNPFPWVSNSPPSSPPPAAVVANTPPPAPVVVSPPLPTWTLPQAPAPAPKPAPPKPTPAPPPPAHSSSLGLIAGIGGAIAAAAAAAGGAYYYYRRRSRFAAQDIEMGSPTPATVAPTLPSATVATSPAPVLGATHTPVAFDFQA